MFYQSCFSLPSLDQYHLFCLLDMWFTAIPPLISHSVYSKSCFFLHISKNTIQNKQSFLLLLKTCFLLSLGADTVSPMVGLKCFENRCYKRNNLQDTKLWGAQNLLLECISGPGYSSTSFILDPGWQLGKACV